MGPSCYYAFSRDFSGEKFNYLLANPREFAVNLLYNFGFMFTDVVNYMFYNP